MIGMVILVLAALAAVIAGAFIIGRVERGGACPRCGRILSKSERNAGVCWFCGGCV